MSLHPEALLPGAVIGIVGGGQLGRMTALAAATLGYRCHVLAEKPDEPAVQVTSRATLGRLDDDATLDAFAAAVDVITYEFENLPLASIERLARTRPVRPSPEVLSICQDRRLEKRFLSGLDVPVAPFRVVESPEGAAAGLAALGTAAVLKTARLGYDGKGQIRLDPDGDALDGFDSLGGVGCVLEGFVDFALEISVVTARALDGTQRSYPAVANRHKHHILAETTAPAPIPPALAAEAVALAERIADALGLTGVLAVELFVTRDGRLLVNELAPRPHNSGHWTIEACPASQFEQVVRAICGLPLGDPTPRAPAVMRNLIGAQVDEVPALLAEPGAHVHLYGKAQARQGRKMGHVTRLLPEPPTGPD